MSQFVEYVDALESAADDFETSLLAVADAIGDLVQAAPEGCDNLRRMAQLVEPDQNVFARVHELVELAREVSR